MNNTYINFHLYGLDVYLTYVYISTHRELGTNKDYLKLTRKLKEKYQFLTIFTSNTNKQNKTFKDSLSFEVQDSHLIVNGKANGSVSPLINTSQIGYLLKDTGYLILSTRNFLFSLACKSNGLFNHANLLINFQRR